MIEPGKVKCEQCKHYCLNAELLVAPNPFDASDEIRGCPACFAIDAYRPVCDETGCKDIASSGAPTPDGYRSTCYAHRPGWEKKLPPPGYRIIGKDTHRWTWWWIAKTPHVVSPVEFDSQDDARTDAWGHYAMNDGKK